MGFSLSSLSSDMQAKLESKAMDFGKTMMENAESNVLGKITEASNQVEAITGSAETLGKEALGTIQNVDSFAKELASQIFDDMSSQISTYMSNVVEDLLKMPTMSEITATAQKALADHLESPADVMKKLTEKTEDTAKKEQEDQKESKFKNFISNTTKQISYYKSKVENIVKTANSYIDTAVAYMQQGPSWVEEKVDQAEQLAMDQVYDTMGALTKTVNDKKQEIIEDIADDIAAALAKPINKAQEKVLQKQVNKIANAKQKGTIKAKAAISTAIMKIKAKFGG